MSFPQHIGIDRAARRKSFRAARARSQASARAIASSDSSPDRQRGPDTLLSLQQHDLGDADAGCNLARQRQCDRLARPAAREPIEHGKRQRPPCRKRLIRRARQHHDGRLADAADRRGAAGLQRDAVGENFAARASAVTAASVRPTPEPPTIRSRSQSTPSSAAPIDPASRPAAVTKSTSAPAARALSAISSAVTLPPGILTMRSRGRRTLNRSIPAARAISEIARQHAPSGLHDETAGGDIAAGPAHALPRDRLRQHLRHRTRHFDGIGIEHAVTTRRHGIAGFDPDRRRGQRQRRIGGCADEIARAKCIAVCGGDIVRRTGRERRHVGGDATQRLRERQFRRRDRLDASSSAASAASSGVSEAGRRWGEVMARLCPESGRK